ncbi:hypothetical protein AB0K81_06135 [Streptomyces werraensis]|uniref:Uncharacterized protein n=1 Tax=Streptomyces werraensis TaxID=68284 RepID=A0ABV3JSS2_9ACTN
MRSHGQEENLDTAYSDHNLVVFLEGVGVAGPETILDDPQWVESGAAATPTHPTPPGGGGGEPVRGPPSVPVRRLTPDRLH